ncbi:hypothetical protein KM043_010408 [Ampulex compressa]|nr:hypothetical protein KM043_010408 [Ampulex compressa]
MTRIQRCLIGLALFLGCNAAPTTYDQRQDGKYNVHAKLENFLIVVATSGSSSDILNSLAAQAIELKGLAPRSSLAKQETTAEYEAEGGSRGKSPFHIEIVHIGKDNEDSAEVNGGRDTNSVKIPRKEEAPSSKKKEEEKVEGAVERIVVASLESERGDKQARNLWKRIRSNDLRKADRESLIDLSEVGDVRRSQEKLAEIVEASNLPGLEGGLKAGRPGISLKKQLSSRKEDEDVPLVPGERNDVGSSESKPQELKLLGGGIENCGPGRYRDKSGVCQFDEAFN